MGHHHQTTNKDSHGIASSIKGIWKTYRSMVSIWSTDKNQSNNKEAEQKSLQIKNQSTNKEPQQKPIQINAPNDKNKTEKKVVGNESNSTTIEEKGSDSDNKNLQKGKKPDESFLKRSYSYLSRSSSRRSKEGMEKSASRSSNTPTPILRSKSSRIDSRTEPANLREAGSVRGGNMNSSNRVSRNASTRGACPAPIVFSHSGELKKPPATEKRLECTLEELCHGCVKKMKIARNVVSKTGQIQKEEETLQIKVKPGWRKGTQITFEGKGDGRHGAHHADVIFTIHEQTHSLFTRNGDDLEIVLEIPLLKALTGCSLSVPLLSGENTNLSISDIIHLGFEKIIQGQGMPKSNEGRRGDLRVKFFVTFPKDLSDEQRKEAYSILNDCC